MTAQERRTVLRAIPSDHVPPPRFRWPTDADRVPTTCGHCGARLLRGDLPTAERVIADIVCLMCSRVAGELVYDGTRERGVGL